MYTFDWDSALICRIQFYSSAWLRSSPLIKCSIRQSFDLSTWFDSSPSRETVHNLLFLWNANWMHHMCRVLAAPTSVSCDTPANAATITDAETRLIVTVPVPNARPPTTNPTRRSATTSLSVLWAWVIALLSNQIDTLVSTINSHFFFFFFFFFLF